MREKASAKSAEQMTRDRIATYRGAAAGWLDVHTYSFEGQVQREITTPSGEDVPPELQAVLSTGFDHKAQPVPLMYDGVMAREACMNLADSLESQLAA